jgi:hypothetical protein
VVMNGMLASGCQYCLLYDSDLSVSIEQVAKLLPPQVDGLYVALGSRELSASLRTGQIGS